MQEQLPFKKIDVHFFTNEQEMLAYEKSKMKHPTYKDIQAKKKDVNEFWTSATDGQRDVLVMKVEEYSQKDWKHHFSFLSGVIGMSKTPAFAKDARHMLTRTVIKDANSEAAQNRKAVIKTFNPASAINKAAQYAEMSYYALSSPVDENNSVLFDMHQQLNDRGIVGVSDSVYDELQRFRKPSLAIPAAI